MPILLVMILFAAACMAGGKVPTVRGKVGSYFRCFRLWSRTQSAELLESTGTSAFLEPLHVERRRDATCPYQEKCRLLHFSELLRGRSQEFIGGEGILRDLLCPWSQLP